MQSLPITSLVAASLGVVMFYLTMIVSMRRVQLGKEAGDIAAFVFGDGDDETLRRRIRAFGNFVEYTPFGLIMLALIEIQGAPFLLVLTLGVAFALGRILHAFGMLFNPRVPLPRIIGMFATYAVILFPAAWLVLH